MSINPELRKLQIDLITDIPNGIQDFFNELWCSLKHTKNVIHDGDIIYYNISDRWVFYINIEHDVFICNYVNYWDVMKFKFEINSNDIKAITKFLVECKLDRKLPIPVDDDFLSVDPIQNALYKKI